MKKQKEFRLSSSIIIKIIKKFGQISLKKKSLRNRSILLDHASPKISIKLLSRYAQMIYEK